MSVWHYLSGPLIGAVIGYFTNYIAVKMLFRPIREVKIGGFVLPFTPGLIPRRKNALAEAAGRAVGNSLLTREDISGLLLSSQMEESVSELILRELKQYLESGETVKGALTAVTGEKAYGEGRERLAETLSGKAMNAVMELKPAELIAGESKRAVRQKLEGTMFAMLLSDRLMGTIAGAIGTYGEAYILEHMPGYLESVLEKEICDLEQKSLLEIREQIPVEEDALREKIRGVYRSCIGRFADSIAENFQISRMVEEKIRQMDVMELENLVMSVMEHELGMIVNLGALIGFVLGLFNMLF